MFLIELKKIAAVGIVSVGALGLAAGVAHADGNPNIHHRKDHPTLQQQKENPTQVQQQKENPTQVQ